MVPEASAVITMTENMKGVLFGVLLLGAVLGLMVGFAAVLGSEDGGDGAGAARYWEFFGDYAVLEDGYYLDGEQLEEWLEQGGEAGYRLCGVSDDFLVMCAAGVAAAP